MLDGGPSRKSQAAERRASMRLGSSRRHEETTQPTAESQTAVASLGHASRPQIQYQDRPRSRGGWIIVVAILIAATAVGWALWYKMGSSATSVPIEKDKYQAVFMSNGEILFGKLTTLDAAHVELSEVFYIRSNVNDATATESEDAQTEDSDMQLIKRGEEVHGPEDAMIINRDQVLYYENLKPSSKVSQLIQKYMSGNR